jgi:hypothetical protein
MGLSLRGYAKHRGCTLFAVQKACRSGRISLLADGTVDAEAADAAWTAAAAARRAVEKAPVDATRVKTLPAGVLASAAATVRTTLAQHGVPVGPVLTLGDARMAGELLRVQQRSNAIARQEQEHRMRLRRLADEAVDKRIVDALVENTIHVVWRFVPVDDVPAALDTLRELVAHCLDRPTPAE